MRKIIFLDIDGVIATPESIEDGSWGLVDSKQKYLEYILQETEAKIVLSSSWRKHNLFETKLYMQEKGFWFVDYIIGITIRAYHYIDRSTNIHLSIPRGVEIKQWIDTNIHSNNGKDWNRKELGVDYQYVILDDDSDMLYSQRNNFVHTSSRVGITKEDALKCINILNNKTT